MIHLQVTYRLRGDRIEAAEREIAAFAAMIQSSRPRFSAYHIFRHADDAASLVHFIAFPDHEAQLEHTQSPHVKRFVENMLALCEIGPIYTELKVVTTRLAEPG